jgi:PAS domain S-box-containing protein
MTGAILDITDRKLAELRQLFLAKLGESLRPLVDPVDITSTAARLLGEHLDADRCVYAQVSDDDAAFDVFGDYHRGVPSMVGQYPLSTFGEDVLATMQADKPFVFDDITAITPPRADLAPYRVAQIQAGISVPLHKNGRLVGGMAVHQAMPRQWTAEEIELVQIVCNRCWESMERARVTRSLQESEAKFRQLTDSIPMIVWEARPDGAVDYYNRRWYEYTGLKPGSLGDESWLPFVHSDDIPNIAVYWTKAVQTGGPYVMELRMKEHRTGEYRWFLARALPMKDAQGRVVRWFGTSTDIHDAKLMEHALRANEERLRAIVEATPECVTVVSRDGALLQMNRSGLNMIGAPSEDAVRGLSALELLAPEHRQRWLENHERVCAGENLHWEFEIIGLDGSRRWMETHGVPVTMPEGERAHLSITRDVTHRKRTEGEREQLLSAERIARAEAEQTGRIKDEFLATLSHELRTPLNAILGYATLMQMSDMDESQLSEAIATIERNARLQAQLIEDLLDMNRIISGKIRLDVQAMDLPDVVAAAVDTVRPSADAKSIRVKTLIDPHAGPVRGDPGRIQQVVWNLLSNAIKFTPKNGSVQVSVERVNSHIEISVADTGEGIAPEFLPHVFDRFRQADSSTTRKYGGLGLGLSIARHLVELHGGAVRATSPGKDQGATFVVSLPLSALHPADDSTRREHPATPTYAQSSAAIDLTGVDVLAVDDEMDACVLVKRVLEGCSAKVETATTAREALQLLQSRKFDVLVSDIGMPVEDGYDLMRAVRLLEGTPRQVRAIALTAFARSEDRRRAALAGFQTHVSKPVEAGELIAIVANLAGRTGN